MCCWCHFFFLFSSLSLCLSLPIEPLSCLDGKEGTIYHNHRMESIHVHWKLNQSNLIGVKVRDNTKNQDSYQYRFSLHRQIAFVYVKKKQTTTEKYTDASQLLTKNNKSICNWNFHGLGLWTKFYQQNIFAVCSFILLYVQFFERVELSVSLASWFW